MDINSFSIGDIMKDKTDSTFCVITNKTTSSIEVLIKKKTPEGVNAKQWFDIKSFTKQFFKASAK